MAEVKGELSKYPELTLDQHPARRGCEAVGRIPGAEGGRGRAKCLPPEVQHLLIEAETDERPQLDIHLEAGLVTVDC